MRSPEHSARSVLPANQLNLLTPFARFDGNFKTNGLRILHVQLAAARIVGPKRAEFHGDFGIRHPNVIGSLTHPMLSQSDANRGASVRSLRRSK